MYNQKERGITMKKILSWVVILLFMFTLCSCSHENPNDDSDQSVLQGSTHFQIDHEDEKYVYFADQTFSDWNFYQDNTAECPPLPQTYAEIITSLGENGIIIAGRAEGLRKAKKDLFQTATTVRIEKVLYGQTSAKTVEITERYYPYEQDGIPSVSYYGEWYTMLKNDELVLLFLCRNQENERYYNAYFALPLPEDYLSYDDAYLTELLDYYRNDKTKMRVVPQETSGKTEIQYEDGTVTTQYSYGIPLEQFDESNEETLKRMNDHVLIQTATQLKIKIWPQNHIRYSGSDSFFGDQGIKELSN